MTLGVLVKQRHQPRTMVIVEEQIRPPIAALRETCPWGRMRQPRRNHPRDPWHDGDSITAATANARLFLAKRQRQDNGNNDNPPKADRFRRLRRYPISGDSIPFLFALALPLRYIANEYTSTSLYAVPGF